MSGAAQPFEKERILRWRELSEKVRASLERRLEDLYDGARDETVFDSLSVDKQQALLILVRRLREMNLWDAVRRVENVYGEGGVGMHFSAWPFLKSTLERGGRFTTWFATHDNTTRGYIERRTRYASLHVLYADRGSTRDWEAHFDLYNPWASPLNAWRHIFHERIRQRLPDWRIIGASLGYLKNTASSTTT